VVVAPVDQRDVDRGLGERAPDRETTEASSNDHDVGSAHTE